jgi:peroxiredoxin
VAQLRHTKSRFDEKGMLILLVGMGTIEQTETFRKTFAPEFSMVCDPEARLYRTYQLKRAGLFQLASPLLFAKAMKAFSSGHRMGTPQGDVFQLPGVFIIDTEGWIRYSHHSRDPADHPEPEELLLALERV